MIRTLIEITGENDWEFQRNLECSLDKIGFEPKKSEGQVQFMADLFEEMRERELDPEKLVSERRARLDRAG